MHSRKQTNIHNRTNRASSKILLRQYAPTLLAFGPSPIPRRLLDDTLCSRYLPSLAFPIAERTAFDRPVRFILAPRTESTSLCRGRSGESGSGGGATVIWRVVDWGGGKHGRRETVGERGEEDGV